MNSDQPTLHIGPGDRVELLIDLPKSARYHNGKFAPVLLRGALGACIRTTISVYWMKFYVLFDGEKSERLFNYFDKKFLKCRPLKRISSRTIP